ncbi:murein hydrolase activator EnvC family protein [Pseudoprevotella muciniphila]|uniref:murein hydrolase activator EnvC family protein n=1 Tax=Pseudoprevotella muciniphila TaxID=2133944 RepID=UPI002938D88D|nr:M23 family metallopeptidase [Pseudoprevotella muciniphila]
MTKRCNRRKVTNLQQRRKKQIESPITPVQSQPEDTKPIYRQADDSKQELSGGFAANKGRLPVPVTGKYAITKRFGSYNVSGLSNIILDNKGIDIVTDGGHARCVYDGTVSTIFSISNYYNVIVRHGNYLTMYCNLSNVKVKEGQRVKTRQELGKIAKDSNGKHTLHFQIRRETEKLNPEQWISK